MSRQNGPSLMNTNVSGTTGYISPVNPAISPAVTGVAWRRRMRYQHRANPRIDPTSSSLRNQKSGDTRIAPASTAGHPGGIMATGWPL